jgi:hypothetical protein
MSRFTAARTAALAVGGALALAACSSGPPASELALAGMPDLSSDGFERIECSEGAVLGEAFVANEDTDYRAECWTGASELPFFEFADETVADIILAIDGEDFSFMICPVDVLSERGGVACRAAVVGEEGDEAAVRVLVVVSELEKVLSELEEGDTNDEIRAVLAGQSVEILIRTEPVNRG